MTAATAANEIADYQFAGIYIDGEWRSGQSEEPIENRNPWNDNVIGSIVGAHACDVDIAYAAAKTNQPVWTSCLPRERAEVFRRAARIMEMRSDEIWSWLVREAGSTLAKARLE